MQGYAENHSYQREKRAHERMSTLELSFKLTPTRVISVGRKLVVPIGIFAVSFLGYYISNPSPIDWYQHQIYLAKAILNGTLDVSATGIPDYYQDVVRLGEHKYLPFPIGPALLLVPFVAVWGTSFSEVYFTMVLGAINVVLFWYLLGSLRVTTRTKLLMVPFFAFGTAHFYSATTGTVWFYQHVSAVFFLLLALIALFKKTPPILPAALLGIAFLNREPMILSAPFFLWWLIAQRHKSIFSKAALFDRRTILDAVQLFAGLMPFVISWFVYNIVRFDKPMTSGYEFIFDGYNGIPYSFYLKENPGAERFGLFDVRNVPLHLYTMFLMPPQFVPDWSIFRPSPYGMSIFLTSPAFVYAFLVRRRDPAKPALWLAIGLISIPLLLHWTQGWVQFGYRFMLDFAPFLLILTAWGFDDNSAPGSRRMQVFLVALSVVAGFWGRYWGNELGW